MVHLSRYHLAGSQGALQLYDECLAGGIKPNDTVIAGLLSALSSFAKQVPVPAIASASDAQDQGTGAATQAITGPASVALPEFRPAENTSFAVAVQSIANANQSTRPMLTVDTQKGLESILSAVKATNWKSLESDSEAQAQMPASDHPAEPSDEDFNVDGASSAVSTSSAPEAVQTTQLALLDEDFRKLFLKQVSESDHILYLGLRIISDVASNADVVIGYRTYGYVLLRCRP